MTELNARIIVKASATASEEPLAADLEVAELAVNTADGKLFTKHTDGSIVTISGGGGGGGGGSSTAVAAFAFGYVNATSAGSGTGVSWGAYDAGTGNVDVTFDTAQVDTSYVVVTDNESADDIGASVSNKTTTGFRLSLYDFASGNPSSPAAYPLIFQVFTSSGGGGATSIDDLSDVDTTTVAPTDGQALVWDNANSQWEPGTVASDLSTASIDALSDVDTTTAAPADGQALVWNSGTSQWEPGGVSGEIEWTLTANGTTDYIFAGAGFAGTEADPTVYVMRGQTYRFTNGMGAHPFQIQSTSGIGGTAYNDGITNNAVSNGTLTWEVRMDAPSTLYYQCTSHSDMNGTIYVLENSAGGTGSSLPDASTDSGKVLASTGAEWAGADISTLLAGENTGSSLLFNFEGSGDSQVLTSTGMTTTYPSTDAKFGSGGATFDRSNADFLQGTWPTEIGTQLFTFSFWIKTSDTDYSNNTSKRIIAPVSDTNLSDGFQIMREPTGGSTYTAHADNAQGAICLSPAGTASGYLVSTRTIDVADGNWHYVVFQHEGSGVYSCFYDGNLTERSTRTIVDFGDNGGFFLGKREDNSSNAYFTGSLDNIVLEIGSILTTGSTVPVPTNPQGQVIYNGSGGTLGDLSNVEVTDSSSSTTYRFGTGPSYTGGRVIVNPNANSAYAYAGLSSWDNGNISLVGGTDSSNRATISLNADEAVYFHPDPATNGATPNVWTIKIEASGSQGDRVLYYNEPSLGTGTSDKVVPTMGQVRDYAAEDSATALRSTLGIGEYADDAAAGTGGVASGAMYYNTTSSDYRLKS